MTTKKARAPRQTMMGMVTRITRDKPKTAPEEEAYPAPFLPENGRDASQSDHIPVEEILAALGPSLDPQPAAVNGDGKDLPGSGFTRPVKKKPRPSSSGGVKVAPLAPVVEESEPPSVAQLAALHSVHASKGLSEIPTDVDEAVPQDDSDEDLPHAFPFMLPSPYNEVQSTDYRGMLLVALGCVLIIGMVFFIAT